jgi:hypothetical protein
VEFVDPAQMVLQACQSSMQYNALNSGIAVIAMSRHIHYADRWIMT